jgi:hypothetical protein
MRDRRFAIFDVGTAEEKNRKYFGALDAQLRNGGAARLLHELLTFDLESVDLATIPETAARGEQKIHGFDPMQSWLHEVLDNGELPTFGSTGYPGVGLASRQLLYADYVAHAKTAGHHHPGTPNQLGVFLHDWLPGISTVWHGRGRYYSFPILSICREKFEQKLGSKFWPDVTPLPEWRRAPVEGPENDPFV